MYILAGVILSAGAAWLSPMVRDQLKTAGATVVWCSLRVYTEIEVRVQSMYNEWIGKDERPPPDKIEMEMVPLCESKSRIYFRKSISECGEERITVGKTNEEVNIARELSNVNIYGPTIRLTENKVTRSFAVDFKSANYCLQGNILFDPTFVAYWLYTHHNLIIEDSDTWTTTFIGPGMKLVTVTDKQEALIQENDILVRDVQIQREEPSNETCVSDKDSWLLDLSGRPSPESV